MDKKNSLFLDPPHILPPDTVLTPQCENCGKPLGSPYHIMIGIPPSSLIVDALPCKSIDEEKDAEKIIIWVIQSEARDFKIDSKNQWIYSKQNIRSSKIRACNQCYEEYTCSYKWNPIASGVRTRKVCFAVEEYQRRHAPIEPNMSDYEHHYMLEFSNEQYEKISYKYKVFSIDLLQPGAYCNSYIEYLFWFGQLR
jgi:hypothetical protein